MRVTECTEVLAGFASPLFSKQKKLSPQDEEIVNFTFSLIHKEPSKSIDFIANNKEEFVAWSDGIRVLLGQRMETNDSLDDIKHLVQLEMRIGMIELEGVETSSIPNQTPSIPPLPVSYP